MEYTDQSLCPRTVTVLFLWFRGMLRSLWVGILIALPSGAGVALSILGGNTGSLVGVAISASLLPPTVNAVRMLCTYLAGTLVFSSFRREPYVNAQFNDLSHVVAVNMCCPSHAFRNCIILLICVECPHNCVQESSLH